MIRLFRVFVPVGPLALLSSEILLITSSFILATYLVLDVDPTVYLLYDGGLVRVLLVVATIRSTDSGPAPWLSEDLVSLKRAIEVGAGISILPLGNIEREATDGHLSYCRVRKGSKWVRPLGILRHRGKAAGPAQRMFLAMLRSKPCGARE